MRRCALHIAHCTVQQKIARKVVRRYKELSEEYHLRRYKELLQIKRGCYGAENP